MTPGSKANEWTARKDGGAGQQAHSDQTVERSGEKAHTADRPEQTVLSIGKVEAVTRPACAAESPGEERHEPIARRAEETAHTAAAAEGGQSAERTISRRKLLAGLGAVGLMATMGGGFPDLSRKAEAAAAAPGLNGTDSAASGWFNVKDFGARGRYDQDETRYIQAAIDAAALHGGTVYLPPGNYTLNSSLFLRSKVRLLGAGPDRTLLKAAKTGVNLIVISKAMFFAVEALTLEGLGAMNQQSFVERGIYGKDNLEGVIADCRFTHIANGIKLDNCQRMTVKHCSFQNVLGSSSIHEGYGIVAESGAQLSFVYNTFVKVDKPCIHLSAGCRSSLIAGNMIQQCKDAAISLSSQLSDCSRNVIQGNMITAEGLPDKETSCVNGIRLREYCTGNVISGNRIERASEAAILLAGTGTAGEERPNDNQLAGNRIDRAAVGISLQNADGNAITGNDIRSAKTGVSLQTTGDAANSYCRSNFVTGNAISRCSEAAIALQSARCLYNAVYGNAGSGNGKQLIDEGKDTVRSGF